MATPAEINIYFSQVFDVDESILTEYGAINISLINDLPLFIDPFLLFNSPNPEYQKIHNEIINYFLYIKNIASSTPTISTGLIDAILMFSEVKQTWLGFSLSGNSGRGMGRQFADGLFKGMKTIFRDFGEETITETSHLEKLCLVGPLIGRDKISDFTTHFAKAFLLEYTQRFAKSYLRKEQCKLIPVPKVFFNFQTQSWVTKSYFLPWFNGDFVLLTPREILTKDDTFINREDMMNRFDDVVSSITDEGIRYQLNSYLMRILGNPDVPPNKKEKAWAVDILASKYPQFIDYYIRYKESMGEEAISMSEKSVNEVQALFIEQVQIFANWLKSETDFYSIPLDIFDEVHRRIMYLKKAIEDQDLYRFFYFDGKPIKRESDLQLLFRLLWYGSSLDVNREVNNGRGPADYKVSLGSANTVLVEFKLASNSKLKQNLQNQVEVYKKANNTKRAIKVILFFTDEEKSKLSSLLNDLELVDSDEIVLIDARNYKVSASNVK